MTRLSKIFRASLSSVILVMVSFHALSVRGNPSVGACQLLDSTSKISEESFLKDIPFPKYGRSMILLGLYFRPQGDGSLIFSMAQRLSAVITAKEARDIGFSLKRKVLTYHNFPEAFPVAGITDTIQRIKTAIDSAIKAGGDARTIFVNLDGFVLSEAFVERSGRAQPTGSVFSLELQHLLRPGYVDKVRWLEGGVEIPPEIAKLKFAPFFQELTF